MGQAKLEKSVMANGGTDAKSENIQLQGTVGQALIGKPQSSTFAARIGFWESVIQQINTSVEELSVEFVGDQPLLGQNIPNPAFATTIIPFTLTKRQKIKLMLFHLNGTLLGRLYEAELGPGIFEFSLDVSKIPSGIYLYSLEIAQKRSLVKKMVVR
jgi:hypothetical protein